MEKRIKELEIALSQQQKFNEKLLDGLVAADKNNERMLGIVESLTLNVETNHGSIFDLRSTVTVLKSCIELGLKPDEIKGVFLALEQMKVKGKATTEEKRRIKPPPPEPPLPRTIKGCKRPNSKK